MQVGARRVHDGIAAMGVKLLAIHRMSDRSVLVKEHSEMVGEGALCSEIYCAVVLDIRETDLLHIELVPAYGVLGIVGLNAPITLPNLSGKLRALVEVAALKNAMRG